MFRIRFVNALTYGFLFLKTFLLVFVAMMLQTKFLNTWLIYKPIISHEKNIYTNIPNIKINLLIYLLDYNNTKE